MCTSCATITSYLASKAGVRIWSAKLVAPLLLREASHVANTLPWPHVPLTPSVAIRMQSQMPSLFLSILSMMPSQLLSTPSHVSGAHAAWSAGHVVPQTSPSEVVGPTAAEASAPSAPPDGFTFRLGPLVELAAPTDPVVVPPAKLEPPLPALPLFPTFESATDDPGALLPQLTSAAKHANEATSPPEDGTIRISQVYPFETCRAAHFPFEGQIAALLLN